MNESIYIYKNESIYIYIRINQYIFIFIYLYLYTPIPAKRPDRFSESRSSIQTVVQPIPG